MQRKGFDLSAVLSAMQETGMQGIDVGLDATDLSLRHKQFSSYPFIYLASGIGPWAVEDTERSIEQQVYAFEQELAKHEVVAIGEIGLDNYHAYGKKDEQERLLHVQLELAGQMNKPVIFHNREADDQFISILKARSFNKKGIMHCFQGSQELANLAVDNDFYLSFAGPLTYKSNDKMQQIFKDIPIEHILLETDSPYLSPVPVRGKPNSPLNMVHIYRMGAELRGMELSQFIKQIQSNFRNFIEQ